MTSPDSTPRPKLTSSPPEPVYTESELYDSPATLARWPLLAPLLRSWQIEVWEKDNSEFRGCWHYDQEAQKLQKLHRGAVVAAAIAGTGAVVLAIVQLGMEHHVYHPIFENILQTVVGNSASAAVMGSPLVLESLCLLVLIGVILFGTAMSLDRRWRELRFKAEHYRMLKFRFLHDAARWLQASEDERGLHIFQHLTLIHSANRDTIKKWIHWKANVLPVLRPPEIKPDTPLSLELADYFRERRFRPQRDYFKNRGKQLHDLEKMLRWIGPGLFWGSVACAVFHVVLYIADRTHKPAEPAEKPTVAETTLAAAENTLQAAEKTLVTAEKTLVVAEKTLAAAEKSRENGKGASAESPAKGLTEIHSITVELQNKTEHDSAGSTLASHQPKTGHAEQQALSILGGGAFVLALFAAILPAFAAGIRTCRGAFEFGRNSLRFESMSHNLEGVLEDLAIAKTPETILPLLRRGEHAMEDEHRAWMRLMMEAEWIG